jgi:hypothetical protein
MRCRSVQNMADILSEGTKRTQRQVIHSTTARSFDEGQRFPQLLCFTFFTEIEFSVGTPG